MEMILAFWLQTLGWLAGLGAVFTVLARLWPCNPDQARPTLSSVLVDACYWLILPLGYRYVKLALMIACFTFVAGVPADEIFHYIRNGFGMLGGLPLWAQMLLILLVQDVYLYGVHRLLHEDKLWRYHAIHHAPKVLDWYSTARFHPVNQILSFIVADVMVLAMGFSPQAIIALVPFNIMLSALVHANLRWDFGPFRYVLASPVFHRWHHTSQALGGMKNFAPTFPFLDMVFGTFYMPKGELPSGYGIHDEMQENIVSQMLYPFRKPRVVLTNESDDK